MPYVRIRDISRYPDLKSFYSALLVQLLCEVCNFGVKKIVDLQTVARAQRLKNAPRKVGSKMCRRFFYQTIYIVVF